MGSHEVRTARLPADGDADADADATPTGRTARQRSTRSRRSVEAPLVLDRYRLHRRLGAGAFGTVWMARDERLERDVAVKLLARDRVLGGRFEREARAAARLAHPAIVTLYEAAVDDEGAYLVSELVLGGTLGALLDAGQLSDRDIVDIAIVLCEALEHAHAHGVVHRDVKPSNVLVPDAPASRSQMAKLTDFGVARVIDSDGLTLTGDVLGTLDYMAPEQAEGLEAGAPADLYSLALVVYEALTGLNPVRATTAFQRARRLGAHLPPLRRQRRDLPPRLGAAIDVALRPRPRDRGTIAELRAALIAARPGVGDEPGIVTGAWTREPEDEEEPFARPEPVPEPERDLEEDDPPTPASIWVDRGLAAVAAAGFGAWTSEQLLAPAPLVPAAAALVAGVAVLLLPRLGWLALTIALCGGALARGHDGAALVIAVAALLPVALLLRRPHAWPLAAAAPALGLIGLAGAWPALAGRAGAFRRAGPIQRAVLGAIGWIWLLLAGAVLGRAHVLYLPSVPGVPPPDAWIGSLSQVTGRLLPALVRSGALAPAVVWALGAVTAPWVVQGRTLWLDVIRAVAWSALVLGATSVAVVAVHGSDALGSPPTAAIGAVACAALALAPRRAGGWRRAWRRLHAVGARLP